MPIRHSYWKFAGVSLVALAAAPALAQTETEDGGRFLDPIEVTATRVTENLQDVPISITTLSGDRLANITSGGADIRFLSARVPSVVAESSFGRTFPRFYIRGIGNTDFDLNSSQPVSLVYDGVPYENPIVKGFPVFDIAQIEVLRGPQGTLFGRNTPGGIIKFDSVKPGEETNGYARASIGRFNTVELEAAIGTRLSDSLAVRFSALYERRDDYVDNEFTGEDDAFEGFDEFAARGQILFTPTERFSSLLNVHGRSAVGNARLFRANIIDPGETGLGDNFDRDAVATDGQNDQDLEAVGVTWTNEFAITDSLDLIYIFGYESAEIQSVGDIDGGFGAAFLGEGNFGPGFIPFPSETSGNVDDLDQFTNEIRLAWDNGGDFRAQGGLFFFNEDVLISSQSFDSLAGNVENGSSARGQETFAYGIFASGTWDVTDRLTLAGGLRYTDDERDFFAQRFVSPVGAPPLGPLTTEVSDDEVSWDVSATYGITDDVNVYARIARGFRAPSAQGRLLFGDDISTADSETVISYEGGIKSELFNGRVRANVAGFYYEINDQQITSVGGADNTVALFNADEGVGFGFEADLEAAITENFLVTAGISYNETEIRDENLLIPVCGAPCTVLDETVTFVNDPDNPFDDVTSAFVDGNPFPNAPEWIAAFTARYAIPVNGGEFFIFTDWNYKDDFNFFFYESVEFQEDGFWEGGLRVGWQGDNGFGASIFGRNILDVDALEGGIDFNNLTGFVNEPAIYGVEVGYSF